VVFTTIIGNSSGAITANAIALDAAGGIYIVGTVFKGGSLPSAVNSYASGDSDAFIGELDSTGNLVRTAYLGGEGVDQGNGVSVDTATPANVIAVGKTCSNFSGPGYTFPAYGGFQEKVEFCVGFITKLDHALDIPPSPARYAYAPTGCTSLPCTVGSATYYFSEFWGGQPTNFPFMGGWLPNQKYLVGDVVAASVAPYSFVNGIATWGTPTTYAERCIHAGTTGLASQGPGVMVNDGHWSTVAGGDTIDGTVVWENEGPPVDLVNADTQAMGTGIDQDGDVFAVGGTDSNLIGCPVTAPPTVCAAQYSYYIGKGAWLLKVNGSNGNWDYSTVLGTTITDVANAVAIDKQNSAYVVGTSTGGIFSPVTAKSFNRTNSGGQDAFVLHMGTDGHTVEYSGYLGGSGDDEGLGVATDLNGTAYITGSTKSGNFPTINPLVNPLSNPPYLAMNALSGPEDAFVAEIVPDGSAVAFSTYLGGSGADHGTGIALHGANNDMYVAGVTYSADFPVYPNVAPLPVQATYAGAGDGFVAMIPGASVPNGVISPTSLGFNSQLVNTTSAPQTVTFTNSGSTPVTLAGITPSGDFAETNTCPSSLAASANCTISVTFTPLAAGTLTGTLTVNYAGGTADIPLAGTGTLLNGGDPGTVSPTGLTFATQSLSVTSLPQTITLLNTASTSVAINSVAISGDFQQTNTCGTSVTAGSSCTISVTFTPTTTGTRPGTVTISDNGSSTPHTVTLSGTGAASSSGSSGSGSGGSSGGTSGNSGTVNLTPPQTTPSVAQGQSGIFQISMSGAAGTVNLACSVASPATCSVPSSVTLDGVNPSSVTVTVAVPAASQGTIQPRGANHPPAWPWTTMPFCVVGVALLGRRRNWLPLMLIVLCLGLVLVGCGGGGGGSSSNGTLTPGSYSVTVTATYSGGSSATASIAVPLQVTN
jgi:hypothetical protein